VKEKEGKRAKNITLNKEVGRSGRPSGLEKNQEGRGLGPIGWKKFQWM
jgi:hypothetical protein